MSKKYIILIFLILGFKSLFSQVFINEGSNKNYTTVSDEDQEYNDWIELFNAGNIPVDLLNYSLTDRINEPNMWVLPSVVLAPGEYKTIFCSSKDRRPFSVFQNCFTANQFTPQTGWNNHQFNQSFVWDGTSDILINICSYNNEEYTSNSVFSLHSTSFFSSIFTFNDGNDYSCGAPFGTTSNLRPDIKLNNIQIGNGGQQNTPTDYPAPYGNWYWAARHQFLYKAEELVAAGLTPGPINSLSFNVISTDPSTVYTLLDFHLKLVDMDGLNGQFQPINTNLNLHTNFSIPATGDTVYLFNSDGVLQNQLFVNCVNLDNSVGLLPDASANNVIFNTPTPAATNNLSQGFTEYLMPVTINTPSGIYTNVVNTSITNPNVSGSVVRYTLDGSEPNESSIIYNGENIPIYFSTVIKARAFSQNLLPSPISAASYLLGIDHVTPVISVITSNNNLYGENGIFENWQFDWQRDAYVEYFDTLQQLIVSQPAAIQVDGGAGGSRSHPQHSFRIEFDNSVLGAEKVNYPFIPTKPYRTEYGKIYLRNGSNQFMVYPQKDAVQTEQMGRYTYNYYSGYRPVSVYINGAYFGLYELREKFDTDFFEQTDNADNDSTDILSQSYWYGGMLREVRGSIDSFYYARQQFNLLNAADTAFISQADQYFDMNYYTDYIISQSWIGNRDWPYNNIKIYRSNKTNFRWRFAIQDFELALEPNGWTNSGDDPFEHLFAQNPNDPYTGIWSKAMLNPSYKNYFINRFADLMNTKYNSIFLNKIADRVFNQIVLEMPKQFARWGNPNELQVNMNNFINNHITYKQEINARNQLVRNFIENNFQMTNQVNVGLSTYPENAGFIKINTIFPDSLPWTGVYFNGNPIKITAFANPGYEFLYWDTNAVMNQIDTNETLTINVEEHAFFRAVFGSITQAGNVIISEINFNSSSEVNTGDWIELHNNGDGNIDISGWKISDGEIFNAYTIPQNTVLNAGEFLVIAENTSLFQQIHPNVEVVGPTIFGFNNNTEKVILINLNGDTLIQIQYSDSLPWYHAADGYGPTLELVSNTLDYNLASSWKPGCIGGSPGLPFSNCIYTILISEINYSSSQSANAGDWFELFNNGSQPIDLSGWTMKDNNDLNVFSFPSQTTLNSGERIVVYQNSSLFFSRFPGITNAYGPFTFGLSSSDEVIRLYDSNGILQTVVAFSGASPWPTAANGFGFTLEWIENNNNQNISGNWTTGCPEGSPGTPLQLPCLITSVNNYNNNNDFFVYPNPINSMISISSVNKYIKEITIYSIEGKFIRQYSINQNQSELDLSYLKSGMYQLQILSGDNEIYRKKIIKK